MVAADSVLSYVQRATQPTCFWIKSKWTRVVYLCYICKATNVQVLSYYGVASGHDRWNVQTLAAVLRSPSIGRQVHLSWVLCHSGILQVLYQKKKKKKKENASLNSFTVLMVTIFVILFENTGAHGGGIYCLLLEEIALWWCSIYVFIPVMWQFHPLKFHLYKSNGKLFESRTGKKC